LKELRIKEIGFLPLGLVPPLHLMWTALLVEPLALTVQQVISDSLLILPIAGSVVPAA